MGDVVPIYQPKFQLCWKQYNRTDRDGITRRYTCVRYKNHKGKCN